MKLRLFFSLAVAAAFSAAAQGGYQDGVDNFNAGRIDVAKAILNNTINDASTDKAVAHFYLGKIAINDGNLFDAKEDFEKGLAANPAYGKNIVGLGELALREGNHKAAEDFFKQALNLNKKDTEMMVEVARAYANVDPVKYAKDIDKQLAKAKKDSKFTEAAVYVLQGDMKAATNPGDAAAEYELAIDTDKTKGKVNREAYVKYANTYFQVNPKFAISRLEEFMELDPNSALAQRELAEKYYSNNQFGSACIQYGKYMENPNHFQSDEQRYAGLLYSAGRYDESLAIANKVLQQDPNNIYMYRVIMLDKAAQKDWQGAEAAGTKLFNTPDAKLVANDYVVYGDVLSELGNAQQAVAIFEKAIELNPDKPELMTKLSAVYERAGQPDKAVEILKQYLDMGNGSTNDLFSMARRYQSLARNLEKETPERAAAANEGIKYIDMAIARVPDNGLLHSTRGQLLLTLNNDKPNADMAQAYEKMLECFDANPANKEKYASYYTGAYYLLGIYYVDVDKAKAKENLQKYLELHPEDEDVARLIESLE